MSASTTRNTLHLILLAAIWSVGPSAMAQEHVFIPVDDWTYTYIERLQRRGHLLELNPTALPYTRGAVRAALRSTDDTRLGASQRRWLELLRSEFSSGRRHRGGDRVNHSVRAGVILDVGMRSVAGERLEVLRPSAPGDPTLSAGLTYFPNAGLHGYVESGRMIANVGARFDLYYRDDPDGLDAANRLISRNDETYVGYNGRFASLHLGRIGRHWAVNRDESTILSRNPVSFDQIAFRIGAGKLSWQGLLGELDSATDDGRFTGTAGADSIGGSIRRYVAVHRVDWRPSRRFGLSIMESALYSSRNSGVSLKFLNPLLIHILSIDGRPKNDENNGLVAGLLWAQLDRWTLSGQLMFDDFDVLTQTGEPASIAVNGSLTFAGLSSLDLGVSAMAVAARAYNTHQPEGRYTFLNRGLATQRNDFVHVAGFAAVFLDQLVPGLTAIPKIDALWQGEADLRMPYPNSSTGFILDGTTERTIRP